MALVTRQGKGSRLTIQEMDNNLLYLEGGALSRNPIIRSFQICGYDLDSWYNIMLSSGFTFNSADVDKPDDRFYGISSIEAWAKNFNRPLNINQPIEQRYGGIIDSEIFMSTAKIRNLPTNYISSIETFVRTSNNPDYSLANDGVPIEARELSEIKGTQIQPDTDFLDNFNSFIESTIYNGNYPRPIYKSEDVDRILDQGLIEKGKINGKSQLNSLWGEFAKYRSPALNLSNIAAGEFFYRVVQESGIFVVDFDGGAKANDFGPDSNITYKPKGIGVFSGNSLRKIVLTSSQVPA